MKYTDMTAEALTAALTEAREKVTALFALETPTVEEVDQTEALMASIGEIEAETARRDEIATDAAARFAAARAKFSNDAGVEGVEGDEGDEGDEPAEDEGDEPAEDESDESAEVETEGTEGGEGEVTTASIDHARGQRISASAVARKVAKRTPRPARAAKPPVTITAAADVPDFATGSKIDGMDDLAKALINRAKGFPAFSKQSAHAVREQTGKTESITKYGVASLGMQFDSSLVADGSARNDYSAVRAAIAGRAGTGEALTAAGWCAPSETVYSYIADYVVDGLVSVPEVSAPRGGLMLTTGPERSSQGTALGDFGFTQTEAQAEAGVEKTFETIVCPDFTDHRLDAVGYAFKIPILTNKAYPELVADTLRYANVLYAHKVNARVISDMVRLSTALNTSGLGATFTDTLEALSVVATRRRRKWNVGENAVMEVVLPAIAREIFRADMSRRTGLALSDVATDQRIDAEFAARRLAVQYVSDWQETIADADAGQIPTEFKAMIYPAGTFIKAVEDVISLQAIHDAASLKVNEYTGVFFEQGLLVAKAGYGSDLVTIPVCSAGLTGAAALTCEPVTP